MVFDIYDTLYISKYICLCIIHGVLVYMCLCCILYGCDWQHYVLCGPLHLYVPLWVEVVVPQDDLVVLAPSGQQGSVPHLTQSENTAIMGLDLTTDLVRTYVGGDRQTEREK